MFCLIITTVNTNEAEKVSEPSKRNTHTQTHTVLTCFCKTANLLHLNTYPAAAAAAAFAQHSVTR